MNEKLKPWFYSTVLFSTITAIFTALILLDDPSDLADGIDSFWMLPVLTVPLILNFWCILGYIGAALEIKHDRDDILIKTLSVLPVISLIFLFFMQGIDSGGFLEGIGIFIWLIHFGAPTLYFIIYIIILKMSRTYNETGLDQSGCEVGLKVCKKIYTVIFAIFAAVPVVIILCTIGYPLIEDDINKLKEANLCKAAKEYLQAADDIITYQNSGSHNGKNLLFTNLRENSVLIDYDEKRVTFIFKDHSDDKLKTYLLKPCKKKPEDDNIQFACPLAAPGLELKTYFDPDRWQGIRNTAYITLKLRDGTVWYAETGGNELKLENTNYTAIEYALKNADDIIGYGGNTPEDGSQFPPYAQGITRDTFCLDRKNMTGSVIYCYGKPARKKYATYGGVVVYELDFQPYYGNLSELVPLAVIPLSDPDEYIIPYQNDIELFDNGCYGIILHTADGYYQTGGIYGKYFGFDKCKYSLTAEEAMNYTFK